MSKVIRYKRYELNAHWSNRLQTAQECAIDLINFLENLEELGTPFITWDYFNTKDKIALIPSDVDEIRRQLLLPRNGGRRPVKADATIPDMGFDVLLFSAGKTSERVTLSMTYGIEETGSRNRCRLNLPTKGEIATQVLQPAILKRLLEVVVQAWKPDWVVVDYFDPKDTEINIHTIPVYWLVYLSDQRGHMPPLPSLACVDRIEGYGSYVITTPEPFMRENPEHLAISNQVKEILGQAGLLTVPHD
jgi:Immunity protein 52